MMGLSLKDRLASRLARRSNGCVEWTGATNGGYGRIHIGSLTDGTSRMVSTHRLAWELVNGPIPSGLQVLHRCDNPPCCNLDHLSLGTQADNMADMAIKGRSNNAAHGISKNNVLNPELIALARRACASGVTYGAMARALGVDRSTISRAVRGISWAS